VQHQQQLMQAIEAQGDEVIVASAASAAHDPVFKLFATHYVFDGQLTGFFLTRSVTDATLPLLFVWHVLRTVMRDGGSTPLAKILRPLLPVGCKAKLPDHLAEYVVTVTRLVRHSDMDAATFPTDFRALLDPAYSDAIFYDMDVEAGVEVTFIAQTPAGVRTLVCMQSQTGKDGSLLQCLRAATPAWQFTTDRQRVAVLAGKRPTPEGSPWSAKRVAFTELAALHAPVFDRAIRVVLTASEYLHATTAICNRLNNVIDSPIILANSTARAFGSAHDRLRGLCEGALTSGTSNAAVYWMPQSVNK
jgi:hypothetical protein